MPSPRRNTPIRTMAHHVSKVYGIAKAGNNVFIAHRIRKGDNIMNAIAASAKNAITVCDFVLKLIIKTSLNNFQKDCIII